MKKHRLIISVFICLLVFLFFKQNFSKQVVLSRDEKESLESLFEYLFCREDFAYVLFGSKPFSIASYWDILQEPAQNIELSPDLFFYLDPKNINIRKGWHSWVKIKSRFENKEIRIIELPNINSKNSVLIGIINIKSLEKTIQDNIEDIQEHFGIEFTARMFLNHILTCEREFFKKLYKNHYILGLLLGYGKRNSRLFQRKIEIQEMQSLKIPYHRRKLETVSPLSSTYIAELEWMEKHLDFFPFQEQKVILNYLSLELPIFLADPHSEETHKLLIEYRKCYNEILKAFKGKDFLETILTKLENV